MKLIKFDGNLDRKVFLSRKSVEGRQKWEVSSCVISEPVRRGTTSRRIHAAGEGQRDDAFAA